MKAFVYFAVIAILIGSASASYVTVTEPFNATINQGGSVFLGKVGPGQTFYITISSATQNITGYSFDRGWNKFVATNSPAGWVVQNSSLNEPSLSIKVTPSPNAQNGTYTFNLTAINLGNYSKLGSLSFAALIDVTPDVFKLQVNPTTISTGPGEPATISVTINNTGVSDSPFVINMQGLPAWNSSKSVIAFHHTVGNFTYPIYENEPGVYHAQLNVTSGSSPLVFKRSNVTLTIQASVLNDYNALGQGALALPIIYAPVYAIMYIISQIAHDLNI
ncbi:MAG: hypothetical protein ACHQX1_02250 [Candidatus Micrarchaeales archaeon]